MLCSLSLRRISTPGSKLYTLRIVGKTALGPSGSGGQDEKRFLSQTDLISALETLKVPPFLVDKAQALMQDEAHTRRFVPIATDIQIPFELLETNDFYLEA